MSSISDPYQTVTNQIIAALEAGTPPWICPWHRVDEDVAPANITTGKAYRGVNVLLLNLQLMGRGFARNRWLTFNQALALGGLVRKGEHGTPIVFFKMHEVAADAQRAAPDANARRVIPMLRSFTVFNVDQVDHLPAAMQLSEPSAQPWDADVAAENLLAASGARIHHGGSRAFYRPGDDLIQLPPAAAFESASDYYGVALHELTHWTAHPERCNRQLSGRASINAYAFEELIAEMGSAFLTNHCRLPGQLQHASYIASWLAALRNDKRLIFTAASQAQKAADFLLATGSQVPAAEAALFAA